MHRRFTLPMFIAALREMEVNVSIDSYRIFIEIVECESFIRAAENLYLTPPAISHAITKMEKEYGVNLFVRDRNGARLTSDGEKLYPYIHAILKGEDRLKQEISLIKNIETGNVCIGTFSSASKNWVPGIINSFRKDHPNVTVNLYEGGYDDIIKWISKGITDVGFLSLTSIHDIDIDFIPLYRDPIMCIAHSEFQTIHPDRITIDDIRSENFVYQRSGYDADSNALLNTLGLTVSTPYSVENDETIVALVESGFGVSLLPQLVLEKLIYNTNVYPLEPAAYRLLGLASMKNRSQSFAVEAFKKHIIQYFHDRYGNTE